MRRAIMAAMVAFALAPGCDKSKAAPGKEAPSTQASAVAEKASAAPAPVPSPATEAPSAASSVADAAPEVDLELSSVKNMMKFNKTELTVKAGAKVHLVFHNESTLEVLPHNWVLVRSGTEATVAAAGLAKGKEAGYVVPGPDVLAATPLAGPQKTVSTTFTAPPAGTYPYICTVPGHYVEMHGKLVVTP